MVNFCLPMLKHVNVMKLPRLHWKMTVFHHVESKLYCRLRGTQQSIALKGGGAVTLPFHWKHRSVVVSDQLEVPLTAILTCGPTTTRYDTPPSIACVDKNKCFPRLSAVDSKSKTRGEKPNRGARHCFLSTRRERQTETDAPRSERAAPSSLA